MVKLYRILLFALITLVGLTSGYTQNTVVTPAAAQTNMCVGAAGYTTLGMIIIAETNFANFNAGNNQTYIMSTPANFEFNTGATPAITANGGGVSGISAITVSATTISFQFNVSGGSTGAGPLDSIRITGVQVRAITAASTGSIARSGGTAIMAGNAAGDGQVHCSLTSVQNPNITGNPGNQSVCTGGNTSFTVTATGTGLTYFWERFNGATWNDPPGAIYSGQGTNTLTLTGVVIAQNGYLFRCTVTGACGPVTSNQATLTVTDPPIITVQPPNRNTCSATTFTITATGATTYQWEVDPNTGTFANVPAAAPYSNTTTNTLGISSIAGLNNYKYRCVVSNGVCSVTSAQGTLTTASVPNVTSPPPDRTICSGTGTTFPVTATGATTYQWEVDPNTGTFANVPAAAPYSNTTTATLNISNVAGLNNYKYRCVITNACGSVNSAQGTLTVSAGPAITTQPVNTTTCVNNNPTFTVVASGVTTYSWERDRNDGNGFGAAPGGFYSGQTTNTLTVNSAQTSQNGYLFRVILTNSCGTTTSNTATLTVYSTATANFFGLNTSYCRNAPFDTLEGFPVGGTFSGPGITNLPGSFARFDAFAAGSGSKTITYTLGCGITKNTTVNDTTNIDYTSPANPTPSYSVSSPSVDLVVEAVPPAGSLPGTFSGTGVSGTKFYPNIAGVGGPYPVSFTFTNPSGCVSKVIKPITVTSPGLGIPPLRNGGTPFCQGAALVNLNPNTVDGGAPFFFPPFYAFAGYSGTGITQTGSTTYQFNPSTPGSYVINYLTSQYDFWTGETIIQIYASQTVTVNSQTAIDFNLPSVACNIAGPIDMNPFPGLLSGSPGTSMSIVSPASPPAGMLSGANNTIFNPSAAGPTQTTFTVRYTYVNASGCTTILDKNITVFPKPPLPTLQPPDGFWGAQSEQFCYGSPKKFIGALYDPAIDYNWYNNASLAPATKISDFYYMPPQPANNNPGTYNYYVTQTVSGCTSDPLTVTVQINDRGVANAGPDQVICEGSTVTLAGSSTRAFAGTSLPAAWSSPTGGGFTPNVNTLNAVYTPTATDIADQFVNLTLTSNDPDGAGPCLAPTDVVRININKAPLANAGGDVTYCSDNLILLQGSYSGSANSITWTGGAGIIMSPGSNVSQYIPTTVEKIGSTVTFTATTNDPDGVGGPCVAVSDQVSITINQQAAVNPGPLQIICEGNMATLNGASTLAFSGAAVPGTWFSPTGGTFTPNVNTLNAVYTPTATDISNQFVDLVLTSDDPDGVGGPCTAVSNQVRININRAASVFAGNDMTYCSDNTILLAGNYSGTASSLTWSGGTGSILLPSSTVTQYNATNLEKTGGIITFTATTNDPDGAGPCVAVSDQVSVTINQEATVNAGIDQAVCRSTGTTLTNLNGTSQYKYTSSPLGSTWSGGVGVFGNTSSLTSSYTPDVSEIPADGTYGNPVKLYLTTNDPDGAGPCAIVMDSVIVTVNPLPRIDSVIVIDTAFCTSDNAFQITVVMQSSYIKQSDAFTDLPGGNQGISGSFFVPNIATIGAHTIRYTFTDANGCSNFRDTLINVYGVPKPKFTITDYCATSPTLFDGSTSDISFDPASTIANYKWNFGDFNTESDTSLLVADSYVYSKTLNPSAKQAYTPRLTVITDKGCVGVKDSTVTIGNIPATDFKWSKICPVDTSAFVDLSAFPSQEVSQYTWNFADGTIINGPGMIAGPAPNNALKNPKHKMANGTGAYNVTYTISTVRGCDSSMTKRVDILDQYRPTPSDPYATNFATDNAFWAVDGKNNSWQWGASSKPIINSSGRKVWVTDTNSVYNVNEDSHLNGPCLNFDTLSKPMISMKIWSATQNQFAGAVLQSSTDGGTTWSVVGKLNDGINWYDNFGIQGNPGGQTINQFGWTGVYSDWRIARISLSSFATKPAVRFRVAFGSGGDSLNLKDGFAIDSVWVGERNKLILLENFTNSNSVAAAANDANMNNLVNNLRPNDVVAIHYHTSFPAPDPMNQRNTADPSARVLQYGVGAVPFKALDGNYDFGPALDTVDIDRRSLETSKFKIKLQTNIAGNTVDARIKFFATDSVKNDFVVHVAVIERYVTAPGNYEWVLTRMLPDAAGTFYSYNYGKGDSTFLNHQWTFLPGDVYNAAELGVVVFIQDVNTKEVYQTAYQFGSGGVPTSLKYNLLAGKELIVYPNPAMDVAHVVFSDPSAKDYAYLVYDELGKIVAQGVIENGAHGFTLNTSNLAGGMYVIRVGNEADGFAYKKLTVNH
ncbi:MAG: T9SS type A sorting domain-containing protein [Cytophagaceae bacterium]|nr:T9SS type A sorting domain-containing protein [Cytophagaceae bacterium]